MGAARTTLTPAQYGYDDYCHVKYRPARPARPLWKTDREAEWRGQPGSDTYYSFYVGRLDKGDEPHYYDNDWANVLGAVELIGNAPADQPLCVYLPLTYPHPPYAVEDPWYSIIDRANLPPRRPTPPGWEGKPSILKGIHERQNLVGWTEERWTELRATYYGMCARVDYQYGLIVESLRRAGIYDDTAIFFFSDHGDFTGDYGLVEKTQNTFEDCLTRVPLLIKPPAWQPVKPRVSEALAELIDVPATIEALAGITPAHTHFGRSAPAAVGRGDGRAPRRRLLRGRPAARRAALHGAGERVEPGPDWPLLAARAVADQRGAGAQQGGDDSHARSQIRAPPL